MGFSLVVAQTENLSWGILQKTNHVMLSMCLQSSVVKHCVSEVTFEERNWEQITKEGKNKYIQYRTKHGKMCTFIYYIHQQTKYPQIFFFYKIYIYIHIMLHKYQLEWGQWNRRPEISPNWSRVNRFNNESRTCSLESGTLQSEITWKMQRLVI